MPEVTNEVPTVDTSIPSTGGDTSSVVQPEQPSANDEEARLAEIEANRIAVLARQKELAVEAERLDVAKFSDEEKGAPEFDSALSVFIFHGESSVRIIFASGEVSVVHCHSHENAKLVARKLVV